MMKNEHPGVRIESVDPERFMWDVRVPVSKGSSSKRPPNILVLDSENAIVEGLAFNFGVSFKNSCVISCTDSAQALHEIEMRASNPLKRVDFLIQDYLSPSGHQGFETARLARKMDPDLDILVCSDQGLNSRQKIDAWADIGVAAAVRKPFDLKTILLCTLRTFKRYNSNINMIVAPSGYGKTTILRMLKMEGVRLLGKVTTRPYRSKGEEDFGELQSISPLEYISLKDEDLLVGDDIFRGNGYGFRKEDIETAVKEGRPHAAATTEFMSAIQICAAFPQNVRIIAIAPPLDFAGFGLERRQEELLSPSQHFETIREEIEYYGRIANVKRDTEKRLADIVKQARDFRRFIPYAHNVLIGSNIDQNINTLRGYIYGSPFGELPPGFVRGVYER